MTGPVERILSSLDRHMRGSGTIRLLGGAAMILGYGRRRMTEDADLLLDEAEVQALIDEADFGAALAETNAELEPLGLYLTHIWGPEQQILTPEWRTSCRPVSVPGLARLRLEVLGPLDLIASKLCRADEGDLADIRHVVAHEAISRETLRSALDRCLVPESFEEVFPTNRARIEEMLSPEDVR